MNALWSADLKVQARNREATLVEEPLAIGFDDFGIDQGLSADLVLQVVHEKPGLDAHLRRRPARSGRLVHGLGHVLGKAHQPLVDLGDLFRALAQHGVADDADA